MLLSGLVTGSLVQPACGEPLPAGKVVWWREGDGWNRFAERQTNGVLTIGNEVASNIVAVRADRDGGLALNKAGSVFSFGGLQAISQIATNVGVSAFGAENGLWAIPGAATAIPGSSTTDWGDFASGLSNVVSLFPIVGIPAGFSQSRLVLTKSGVVLEWNSRSAHSIQPFRSQPGFRFIEVGGQILSNVTAIASGGANQFIALKSDGTAWLMPLFWQHNSHEMKTVSRGTAEGLVQIVAVLPVRRLLSAAPLGSGGQILSNVIALAGSDRKVLALLRDGTVAAFAFNRVSNPGANPGLMRTYVPSGLSNVVAIATSETHHSALKRDGTVTTWTGDWRRQDTVPAGLSNVVAVAAGNGFSLAITTGDLPTNIYVPPHGPLEEMAVQADVVFKGEALEIETHTNSRIAAFAYSSAMLPSAATVTRFKVISLLKGSVSTNEIDVVHFAGYDNRSAVPAAFSGGGGRMAPNPAYTFGKGNAYLIFAKKSAGWRADRNQPALSEAYIVQPTAVRHEPVPRAFEPVTHSLDNRPLGKMSVNEAHWFELNLLLHEGNVSNQLYAIRRMSSMATDCGDTWQHSHDFRREAVLAALQSKVHHANDDIAIAAIGCFQTRAECASQLEPYVERLIEIASEAASASRRKAAVTTFAGTSFPEVSVSLPRWLIDSDATVRAQAVRLLPDYPGAQAERALNERAGDSSDVVRAAVAETIGKGRFVANLPALAKLFDESDDNVHAKSRLALLEFKAVEVDEILESRLNDAGSYVEFLAKLSESDATPWLPRLVSVLEGRFAEVGTRGPSAPGTVGAGVPRPEVALSGAYAKCWHNVFSYLMTLPSSQFSRGKMSQYTDLLEKLLPKNALENRSAVHQMYELYKTKNLRLPAKRIRRQYKDEKGWFDNIDRAHAESST